MDELLTELKTAAQGLSPDQISTQIQASQHAELIQDPDQLSRFILAVAAVGDPNTEVPESDLPLENAGNP